ncbi:hypothetical protein Daura_41170 [Dactylosporangium aurantiacum]|uniref:Terpene synthase n=1 Tax=Dactylosporangium aurantiacum TaxID=35754 RepID=A0A9Q9IBY2_9ACTN|nr:hypothetical protein [Dactylosporangium aurantiacum]MDG6102808.1 hypothetical protein [Dactylosporangium aurantiacum]UWZ52951.1 hypothetical protein Daura_41170 [Dactylosporangium aurantiacum]
MQSTLAVLCPFTPRLSPHADAVQRWSLQWATRHGLLDRPGARAVFARARFANLMARTYPDAAAADLRLATAWLISVFALDDRLERAGGPAATRHHVDEVRRLLRDEDHGKGLPKGHLRALGEVWRRTRDRVSPAWRERFTGHIGEYLEATVWEAGNRAANRPPPVAEYRVMRFRTAAVDMFFDLIEPLHGVELPAAVLADRDFAAMRRAAGMITAIFNDLVSWPKEEAAGDHHNIVLALRHERRLPVEAAVRAAVGEHDALVDDFVAARARFAAGPLAGDPAVAVVAADLAHWIRGNVDWSMESGRYTPAEVPGEGSPIAVPAQRRSVE